jgi:hypothetical protein
MNTGQPTQFAYWTNYHLLMPLAQRFMPLMPERIVERFAAPKLRHMEDAECNPEHFHPDQFDLIVDWGCTANTIIRTKIAN